VLHYNDQEVAYDKGQVVDLLHVKDAGECVNIDGCVGGQNNSLYGAVQFPECLGVAEKERKNAVFVLGVNVHSFRVAVLPLFFKSNEVVGACGAIYRQIFSQRTRRRKERKVVVRGHSVRCREMTGEKDAEEGEEGVVVRQIIVEQHES